MNKTEQQLNRELTQLMPDSDAMIDAIWDTPFSPMTEPDDIVRQTKPETATAVWLPHIKDAFAALYTKIAFRPALSFALCLLILAGITGATAFHATYAKPDTLVAIDVNPGVELTTNRKNQVIKVDARNEDAEAILDGMELKHVDLNIAVNAIIGSMLKHGYLGDDDNVVLISVSNKEQQKADAIKQEITEDITSSLEVANRKATVLQQDMENADKSLNEIAQHYHITVGKVQLINEILAVCTTDYSMDELANYTMRELAQLADTYGIDLEQTTADEDKTDRTKATGTPKKSPDKSKNTPARNTDDDSTGQDSTTTQKSTADSSSDSERDYEEPERISNTDDNDAYDEEDEAEDTDDVQLPAQSTTSAPSTDDEENLPGRLSLDSYDE